MRIGDLKLVLEEMVHAEGQLHRNNIELTDEEDALILLAKMLLTTINSNELSEETKNKMLITAQEFINLVFKMNRNYQTNN